MLKASIVPNILTDPHSSSFYRFFTSSDPAKVDDAFYTREREIAEIEGLLPEIVEKITDTEDLRTETLKKLGDKRADEEALKADASEPPAAVENSEG